MTATYTFDVFSSLDGFGSASGGDSTPVSASSTPDYRDRDSFALDLMEAARPAVDSHVIELLGTRGFTRRDFAETARGVCRVNPPLSHELAETGPRWAEAIAPAAEAVAQLLARCERSRIKQVSTPLTGSNRSARYENARRRAATKSPPKKEPMPACKRCGGALPRRGRVYCDDCLPHYQREQYQQAFHCSGPQGDRAGEGRRP